MGALRVLYVVLDGALDRLLDGLLDGLLDACVRVLDGYSIHTRGLRVL